MTKPKKVLMRAFPSTFKNAVDAMADAKKEWVTNAGLGALISFSMRKFPHAMAVNVLWCFDYTKSQMCFHPDRNIEITEDDVNEV